jgi:hypothetical protein
VSPARPAVCARQGASLWFCVRTLTMGLPHRVPVVMEDTIEDLKQCPEAEQERRAKVRATSFQVRNATQFAALFVVGYNIRSQVGALCWAMGYGLTSDSAQQVGIEVDGQVPKHARSVRCLTRVASVRTGRLHRFVCIRAHTGPCLMHYRRRNKCHRRQSLPSSSPSASR